MRFQQKPKGSSLGVIVKSRILISSDISGSVQVCIGTRSSTSNHRPGLFNNSSATHSSYGSKDQNSSVFPCRTSLGKINCPLCLLQGSVTKIREKPLEFTASLCNSVLLHKHLCLDY